MATLTTRIQEHDHARLARLAEREGRSMTEVLGDALREYERKRLFEQTNEAYVRLREDPAAYEAELRERRLMEGKGVEGIE